MTRRLRRAHALVAYWANGDLVIENYLSHTESAVSPGIIPILSQLNDFSTRANLRKRFQAVPNIEELISRLVEQTILVEEGSALEEKDARINDHWDWGRDAQYFHYATQHVDYDPDIARQREGLIELARQDPPPSPFQNYDAPVTGLEETLDGHSGGLWDVLTARRTVREYVREQISFTHFSTLVQWTWGHTNRVDVPDIGEHILKTSPSGGARHPIEVYPIVHRVEGIEPGLYHYAVENHTLERLQTGTFESESVDLCGHQNWVGNAAAVFLMTAVVKRSMWKYDHSRAYRVILLDAGHLGQTFHLVASALNLGPFTTAATLDQRIEELIGLDGVTEFPVYAAAVGVSDESGDGPRPEPK